MFTFHHFSHSTRACCISSIAPLHNFTVFPLHVKSSLLLFPVSGHYVLSSSFPGYLFQSPFVIVSCLPTGHQSQCPARSSVPPLFILLLSWFPSAQSLASQWWCDFPKAPAVLCPPTLLFFASTSGLGEGVHLVRGCEASEKSWLCPCGAEWLPDYSPSPDTDVKDGQEFHLILARPSQTSRQPVGRNSRVNTHRVSVPVETQSWCCVHNYS